MILLTIATNNLADRYKEFIATHRLYAERYGYTHVLVAQSRTRLNEYQSAWLKIPLIELLLRRGPVLYVDADAEIKKIAPPIESLIVPGKQIYMAHGWSGRFNAGVIFATSYHEFFRNIRAQYLKRIPRRDRAPYENGHVIHFAKNDSRVQRIDIRWNNAVDKDLPDYIRHYTGTLRKYRPPAPIDFAPTHPTNDTGPSETEFPHWIFTVAQDLLTDSRSHLF
jgi:hypothetical protein